MIFKTYFDFFILTFKNECLTKYPIAKTILVSSEPVKSNPTYPKENLYKKTMYVSKICMYKENVST